MKRWINILVGLLAVQAALFFFLNYKENLWESKTVVEEKLLSLEFDKLDKVTIEASDKSVLELAKKDGVWVIPKLFDFPIWPEKIQKSLKHLTEVTHSSWAHGKTKASAKQFEVTEDKFERRIMFYVGDEVKSILYLGGSPGYKKVYTRVEGHDETYSIEFNAMDMPTDPVEWSDRDIYKLDRAKISKILLSTGIELEKKGRDLLLTNLKEDEETDTGRLNSFINRMQNPRFDDVLAKDTYAHGAPYLKYTVTLEGGVERAYEFFKMKTAPKKKAKEEKETREDAFVLKVSNLPYYFKVSPHRIRDLKEKKREEFIKKKNKKDTGTTGLDMDGLDFSGPG